MIRIALVEDNPVFHGSLSAAIGQAEDMQEGGCATTLAGGLSLLAGEPADVLLVDLGLPDGSGLDIIRAAKVKWPQCEIMVVTMFGDETHVLRAIENGASGYLLKDGAPEKIVEEIRSLMSGGSPISPHIARHILMRVRHSEASAAPPSAGVPQTVFSERELETLKLASQGFTSHEIAAMQGISRHTVLTYVRRIYKKLGVNSQRAAINEARRQGILRD